MSDGTSRICVYYVVNRRMNLYSYLCSDETSQVILQSLSLHNYEVGAADITTIFFPLFRKELEIGETLAFFNNTFMRVKKKLHILVHGN